MARSTKAALLARTPDQLVDLATHLAAADNDWRWALIKARRDAGLSQQDVADMFGVTQPTIAAFEHHDNDPRLSTLRRYALAVGAAVSHRVETAQSDFMTNGWSTLTTPGLRFTLSDEGVPSQVSWAPPAESVLAA